MKKVYKFNLKLLGKSIKKNLKFKFSNLKVHLKNFMKATKIIKFLSVKFKFKL